MAEDKKYEQVKIGTKRLVNGFEETLMELKQELEETGEIEDPDGRIRDLIDEMEYYQTL